MVQELKNKVENSIAEKNIKADPIKMQMLLELGEYAYDWAKKQRD